jgi:hypothetical protein
MSLDDSLTRLGSRLTPLHYVGGAALFVVVVLVLLIANRAPTGEGHTPQATALRRPSAAAGATVQVDLNGKS